MSEKPISQFVEDMLPSFYNEEGPLFVQFVKAYYEWTEQQGNVQSYISTLTDQYDVDKSIDEFISHFRAQYLPSIEFSPSTDRKQVLKHAREFLATKGTEENVKLLLRLVYNQSATVFRPNDKVLRPSDGVWFEPKYIEMSVSDKGKSFVGKTVYGSRSGASALVERVVRKTVKGVTFDVAYITNVKGQFLTKEVISADGLLDDCPVMIGSLTSIDLNVGGKDFNIGDVVNIESVLTGKSGLARVSDVGTATGRVTFDLNDGGWGFTNNALVYISDRVINLSNKTPNPEANTSNGKPTDFILLEQVVQPIQTVSLVNLSTALTVNTFVQGYSATNTVVASGYVIGVPASFSSNNQTVKIIVHSGSFTSAANVASVGNASLGIIDTTSNTYATGLVIGNNPSFSPAANSVAMIGVAMVKGSFTANTPYAFVKGTTSNTYANVSVISTGENANFDVGMLTHTEDVFINIDRLGANNVYGVPFTSVKLTTTGFVEDITVVPGTPNTTHLFISGGGTQYTEGDVETVTFVPFASNISANVSTTSNTITINGGNNANLYSGLVVSGTGIPANTYVMFVGNTQSSSNTTALVLSKTPTSSANNRTLTLTNVPTENASAIIVAADGVLRYVTAANSSARGTGYANGQLLVFTGNTKTVSATLYPGDKSATIQTGNTNSLYVGLAVAGNNIPSNTFITSIDPDSGTLYLSNAPTSGSVGTILRFPAAGYITVNASGAIASLTITSQGAGYTTAPTISVLGGTSGVVANLAAVVANGIVVDTRVDNIGSNYGPGVTVTTSTSGVAASLAVLIDSGYGFTKDPNADLDTILANALTSNTFTLGSISSITDINLGTGYNQDPFVLVIEPITVGFNRRGFILGHDNPYNNFAVGETIVQNFEQPQTLITYGNKSSPDFLIGELVVQGDVTDNTTPRGIISAIEESSSTVGSFTLDSATGTFAANTTQLVGQTSGAVANISVIDTTSVLQTTRGVVTSVSNGYISVKRQNFNLSFTPDLPIVGSSTGTTANVITIDIDPGTLPIGFNAQIDAQAGTIEGFIKSLEIIDSGFAYGELEPVEIKRPNNDYIATGYARLNNQGQGEGYFTSDRGFLNDRWNYIHDNDYWQEYSYEVRTGISLSQYGDVLKQASHVAGTKFFGMIEKVMEISEPINSTGSVQLADAKLAVANGTPFTKTFTANLNTSSNTIYITSGNSVGLYANMVLQGTGLQSNTRVAGVVNTSAMIITKRPSSNTTSEITGTGRGVVGGERLLFEGNTLGNANGSIQGEMYASGYMELVSGSVVSVPNVSFAYTQATIETVSYTGQTSNTTFLTLRDVEGELLSTEVDTAEVYTNTFIISTSGSSAFQNGIVYQLPAPVVESISTTTTYGAVTRGSDATFRTSNGYLDVVGSNITRPRYNANGVFEGILVEAESTNLFPYSQSFAESFGWVLSRASIITDDIPGIFAGQQVDKLVASAEAGTHEVKRSIGGIVSGQTYTISCFFKAAEYGFGALTLPASRFGADQTAIINLSDGQVSVVEGSPVTTVEEYANGWYRLGVSAVATSSNSGTFYIRVANSSSVISWTPAVSTHGIHIGGAQLEIGGMSSWIPTTSSASTRAQDVFAPSATAWDDNIVKAGGVAVSTSNTYVAVCPFTRIGFNNKANNAALPVGKRVVQLRGGDVVASGNIVYSNTSTIVVTTATGPFSKYNGKVYLANTQLLSVVANATSNISTIQVGEVVSQSNSTVTVEGVVYSKNTSHIVVTSANGVFVPSVSNTVFRLIGSNSSSNVFVSAVDSVYTTVSTISRVNSFSASNTFICGHAANASPITNAVHNSTAQIDSRIVSISNTINMLMVSEYQQIAEVGDTIQGSTSGAQMTILSIGR